MKTIDDAPKEPDLHCSMSGMGLGLYLGFYDDQPLGGGTPAPPAGLFSYGGVLGNDGFGAFVFGAQDGF